MDPLNVMWKGNSMHVLEKLCSFCDRRLADTNVLINNVEKCLPSICISVAIKI